MSTSTTPASAPRAAGTWPSEETVPAAASQEASGQVTSTPFGPVRRPMGLETEYGVLELGNVYASAEALSSRVVEALSQVSRDPGGSATDLPATGSGQGSVAAPVRWDYEGEDPLADLRGGRLDRATAHPSQLTDDPARPAPSGGPDGALPVAPSSQHAPSPGEAPPGHGGPGGCTEDSAGDDAPGCSGTDLSCLSSQLVPVPAPSALPLRWGSRPRPSRAEAALPRAGAVVLTNGGRFYVDHAHPEYASPEVLTPRDALTWDRAGEVVARRAMASLPALSAPAASPSGRAGEVVLYKNNVDGKGAAYGSHESYLLRRDLPFDDVAAALIPFLLTRPVVAGSGRVGIGQRSQKAGFQIAQRSDYVENEVGLQTTFNRPIVNTRDEPHADARRYRRLHLINGDANRLDTPVYLKTASTCMLLWYLERAYDRGEGLGVLAGLSVVGDPVEQLWAVSHDTTLAHRVPTDSGPLTALEIQRAYLDAVREALTQDAGGTQARHVGQDTAQALALWAEVLDELEDYAQAVASGSADCVNAALRRASRDIEWLAKLQLCEGLRSRASLGWDDPRLAALDIQWADLRAGKGLAEKVVAAGLTRRIVTETQVRQAASTAPRGTRAALRGDAVASVPEVVAASWTSLVLDVPGQPDLLRLSLPEDVVLPLGQEAEVLVAIRDAVGASARNGAH